jgi:hypothetical protein
MHQSQIANLKNVRPGLMVVHSIFKERNFAIFDALLPMATLDTPHLPYV